MGENLSVKRVDTLYSHTNVQCVLNKRTRRYDSTVNLALAKGIDHNS